MYASLVLYHSFGARAMQLFTVSSHSHLANITSVEDHEKEVTNVKEENHHYRKCIHEHKPLPYWYNYFLHMELRPVLIRVKL